MKKELLATGFLLTASLCAYNILKPSETTGIKDVNLGVIGLANPDTPTDNSQNWGNDAGNYIYFGKYFQENLNNKTPIKWKILNVNSRSGNEDSVDSIFVVSDAILDVQEYDTTSNTDYSNSVVNKWLNNDFINSAFDDIENTVICNTSKEKITVDNETNHNVSNSKVFLLSHMEASSSLYGFFFDGLNYTFNNSRKILPTNYAQAKGCTTSDAMWQLRTSKDTSYKQVAYIKNGILSYENTKNIGIAPALNIEQSKIMYNSKTGLDKTRDLSLTQASEDNNEWNITLQDGTGFNANIVDGFMNTVAASSSIKININSLPNESTKYSQLSAMIVDDNGTVIAYGKVSDKIEKGIIDVKIPESIPAGFYILKLFAEKVNSSPLNNAVDFISNMIDISIIVTSKVDSEKVAHEENAASHTISAKVYSDAQHTSLVQTLTENGVSLTNWEYNTSRYVLINVDLHASETPHTVRIELARELYFVNNVHDVPLGCSDVKFEKNTETINVNGGAGTFGYHSNTGILTCYLQPNITSITIPLELRYDDTFWDRKGYSSIAPEGKDLIKVSLNYELTKGNYNTDGTLKTLKVNTVTTGAERGRSGLSLFSNERLINTRPKAKDCALYYNGYESSFEKTYFKEMIVEINIPYCYDKNAKKVYLKYDKDILYYNYSFYGDLNYEIIESSESTLKFKINDALCKTSEYLFKITFEAPSDIASNSNFLTFSNGSYKITATNNANKTITSLHCAINSESFAVKDIEAVSVSITSSRTTGINTSNLKEGALHMGGFFIENQGTINSKTKSISLSFPKQVLITTLNAPFNTLEPTIKINYSLKDASGTAVTINNKTIWTVEIENPNYNSSKRNNTYVTVSRLDLPDEHKQYYFSSISYDAKLIPAGTQQYINAEPLNSTSGGNYYGYFTNTTTNNMSLYTTVKIVSEADSGIPTITKNIKTTPTTTLTTGYGLDVGTFAKNTIEAGEDVELKGSFFIIGYPYGNISTVKNIKFHFQLPKGVTVDNLNTMKIETSTGNKLTPKSLTYYSLNSTQNMWTVELYPSYVLGYYHERLKPIDSGYRIYYTVVLKTDKTLNNTTLYSSDVLWATCGNRQNVAGGWYTWALGTDIYDLNNNNSSSDKIAKLHTSYKTSCTINKRSPKVELEDNITISNGGTVNGKFGKTTGANNIITYTVKFNGESNSTKNNCEYYIPIPKVSSTQDNKLIYNSTNERFDFKLLENVSVTSNATASIKYTTQTGLTYETASSNTSIWKDVSEINIDDVTMVKLILNTANSTIGFNAIATLKLQYNGINYDNDIGQKNIWKTYGTYSFSYPSLGNIIGISSSDGCSVRLGYTEAATENVTLIATPNEDPTKTNVSSDDFPKTSTNSEINKPAYKRKQSYNITNIELNNITLQSKEYLIANQESMTSTEANKTFAFTLQTKDGNEIDILNAIDKNIGGNEENELPNFIIKVYYGSKFNDNVTQKSITITLTSDLGLVIKVKVNVIYKDTIEFNIQNSEIINSINTFYIYEDDNTIFNNPFKIMINSVSNNSYSNFILSTSNNINDRNAYISSNNIKIYDTSNSLVTATNGMYKLNNNTLYNVFLTDEYISSIKQGSLKLYALAYTPTTSTTLEMLIIKRHIFRIY